MRVIFVVTDIRRDDSMSALMMVMMAMMAMMAMMVMMVMDHADTIFLLFSRLIMLCA